MTFAGHNHRSSPSRHGSPSRHTSPSKYGSPSRHNFPPRRQKWSPRRTRSPPKHDDSYFRPSSHESILPFVKDGIAHTNLTPCGHPSSEGASVSATSHKEHSTASDEGEGRRKRLPHLDLKEVRTILCWGKRGKGVCVLNISHTLLLSTL